MLIGEYSSPLGEKNRIALPKKLRDQIGDNIVVARGYEHCLIVLDRSRWSALIDQINTKPLLQLDVRDTKRFLLGGAQEINLDSQGRFVVPDALIKYANLQQQLTFIGVGEWIEIWDADKWQQKLDYLAENSADIADRL